MNTTGSTSPFPLETAQTKTVTFIQANKPALMWGVGIIIVVIILFMLKPKAGK